MDEWMGWPYTANSCRRTRNGEGRIVLFLFRYRREKEEEDCVIDVSLIKGEKDQIRFDL